MLKMKAHTFFRKVACLQNSHFYTVMVDETTDISNSEQVVLCFRWVDKVFVVHEVFLAYTRWIKLIVTLYSMLLKIYYSD